MTDLGKYGLALALALAVAFLPQTADAQQDVSIDFRGGISIPAGDLADFQDVGPSFGIGVNVGLTDRISARVAGNADLYTNAAFTAGLEEGEEVPDIFLTHIHAGGIFHALESNDSRFTVDIHAGGGITVFSTPRRIFSDGTGGIFIIDMTELYPSLNAGATFGYQVTPSIRAFLAGQGFLAFADEDETFEFSRLREDLGAIDDIWSFPISLGISLFF